MIHNLKNFSTVFVKKPGLFDRKVSFTVPWWDSYPFWFKPWITPLNFYLLDNSTVIEGLVSSMKYWKFLWHWFLFKWSGGKVLSSCMLILFCSPFPPKVKPRDREWCRDNNPPQLEYSGLSTFFFSKCNAPRKKFRRH